MGEILARQELFLFTSAFIQQFEILPPEGQDKIIVKDITGQLILPSSYQARFVRRL